VLDTPEESYDKSQNRLQQTDSQQPASDSPISPDDSPELLRWRADILLDEMMLGAVDIAAGRPEAVPSDDSRPPSDAFYGSAASGDELRRSSTNHVSGQGNSPSSRPTTVRQPWSARAKSLGGTSSEEWPSLSGSESTAVQGAQPQRPQVRNYRPDDSAQDASENAQQMLRPPSASTTLANAQAETPGSQWVAGADRSSGMAPWRLDTPEQPDGKRSMRSNLLPRESQFDARSHFQEIDRLEAEVDATLPAEHEWSVRSRHLLAKATDILQNSPERSAEVDYYLQQVRSILSRAQQTYQWSLVYTKRLKLYLMSWALFALVLITAFLLYSGPLSEMLAASVLALTNYGAQSLIASTIVAIAGTMGASVGALRNMLVYRSVGRGYVDRKYSLRGLLLPLLAGLFGLLVYTLFGIIFYFADIDPMQNILVVGVPALLALAFGLTQEALYGTAG
jgi:hypothetical protein